MDERTLWALLLIGLAIILLLLEVFIPSGGIIGILAGLSIIGAVVMLFWIDTTLGLISAIICVMAIPFAIAAMMKLWPNTPLFRLLALQATLDRPDAKSEPDPAVQDAIASPSKKHMIVQDLHVGDLGIAETSLRPVGSCRIGNKRIDCIADGDLIDPGTKIRITHIDGMQVKVRPV